VRLDELAKKFGNKIHLLCIYIREAHPDDGDQVLRNIDEEVVFNDPKSMDEREEIASACMLHYNFSFPMLMDKMDNAAEEAYQGWPDRLYLINSEAKIEYQGGLGPLYFDVNEFEKEVIKILDS